MGEPRLCGGVALDENIDMVECNGVDELDSLYQVSGPIEPVVKGDSVSSCAFLMVIEERRLDFEGTVRLSRLDECVN